MNVVVLALLALDGVLSALAGALLLPIHVGGVPLPVSGLVSGLLNAALVWAAGAWPDPARLAGLVGPARAKMILMAGQKIEAEEALAWGLIDRITPPETLLATAMDLAADVVAASPNHAKAIKKMLAP